MVKIAVAPHCASRSTSMWPSNARLHATPLQSATLRAAVLERSRQALASGALAPIGTVQEPVDDGGVRFVVRQASTLARKPGPPQPGHDDAFRGPSAFPIEPDLLVGELSGTHLLLLNKFPVIPHHVLLVTRRYVPQEAALDRDDFSALAAALSAFDGLGFYNGGVAAGASQPHKHLQLVPLPLGEDRAVPMETVLERAPAAGSVTAVPGLAFRHAFVRCDARSPGAGARLAERYVQLLAAVGMQPVLRDGVPYPSGPYNLVVTAGWMLLVPRTRPDFHGIGINALGYAGSIVVRTDAELRRVREAGPMTVLRAVAHAPR